MSDKIPSYKMIPSTVEYDRGEHCSIIVYTGKMFFVMISLDCSLLPNCSDELPRTAGSGYSHVAFEQLR